RERGQSPRMPRRTGTLAPFVAVFVLAAGCAQPDPPGVGVQKLAADIVFGVKPPPPDTPPANTIAGGGGYTGDATTYVPYPQSYPTPSFPAPRAPRPPTTRLPRPTPLNPPKAACPPAALNAFPAVEAGLTVAGLPAEGQYRWKRTGTQTMATLPNVAIPISGFEQRLIREVKKVSETEFTFQTVQPELGTGVTVLQTFKVKTDAVSRGVEPPVQTIPLERPEQLPDEVPFPSNPSVPSRRVGDPERGISLMRIERVDAQGNSSVLNFTPAVLFLPLAIEPGESFESVGIDSRSGQVLQHQAQVVRRERVDACGEIVDGWVVEANQTFSGSGTATRTYRYIIAPQLGGVMISEQVKITAPEGTLDVTFSLGQTKPAPLPAQAAQ
ncbi:MAG: hypothetical protein ACRDYV_16635, partial [Acidimicrobiia bacterium]